MSFEATGLNQFICRPAAAVRFRGVCCSRLLVPVRPIGRAGNVSLLLVLGASAESNDALSETSVSGETRFAFWVMNPKAVISLLKAIPPLTTVGELWIEEMRGYYSEKLRPSVSRLRVQFELACSCHVPDRSRAWPSIA